MKALFFIYLILICSQGFGNPTRKFRVVDKKAVVQKDTARYRSFPSIVKIKGNHLLMAYRDGHSLPNVKAHGIKGDTRLIEYKNGKWSSSKLL